MEQKNRLPPFRAQHFDFLANYPKAEKLEHA
jgi:hypothetical protein